MAERLKLGPTESLTIRLSTPDLLEVEATYGPSGKPPPKHFHPAQDEHFEVLEGEVQVRIEGSEHTLGKGMTIDIPRERVHQMWNAAETPARVLWQTRPAGRTEDWFRGIDRIRREAGDGGKPSPLAFVTLLHEYEDVFRLAAGPDRLVRGATALLAPLGRLRGHSSGA